MQITASASVYDTIPDTRYLWRLAIYDADTKKITGSWIYGDDEFTVPVGEKQVKRFSDSTVLPQGKHVISLSLHTIYPGEDSQILKDANVLRSRRVASRVKPAVVP